MPKTVGACTTNGSAPLSDSTKIGNTARWGRRPPTRPGIAMAECVNAPPWVCAVHAQLAGDRSTRSGKSPRRPPLRGRTRSGKSPRRPPLRRCVPLSRHRATPSLTALVHGTYRFFPRSAPIVGPCLIWARRLRRRLCQQVRRSTPTDGPSNLFLDPRQPSGTEARPVATTAHPAVPSVRSSPCRCPPPRSVLLGPSPSRSS